MNTNEAPLPLRVLFLVTSMPVGGAETLLVDLVRRMDRKKFLPEVVCLKQRGPLGDRLAAEMPIHCGFLTHKFDVLVLWRLWRLMRMGQTDAVITVGAGDKMFWGRLAARLAGVPVVIAALHSTGWPDSVGRLNRLLTPITDAFIGVAEAHGEHLIAREGFPEAKVHVIANGVDTDRFIPGDPTAARAALGLKPNTKTVGILAALRPEKNHELFLSGAANILQEIPDVNFLVIGDGRERQRLEKLTDQLGIREAVHFLGSRSNVENVLPAVDVLALTSHNEASPVSVLEGLSCEVAVVAADVGSVSETIVDNVTGKLFPAGDLQSYTTAVVELLRNVELRASLGAKGRQFVVENRSLESMVSSYEDLLERLYFARIDKTEACSVERLVRSGHLPLTSHDLSSANSGGQLGWKA